MNNFRKIFISIKSQVDSIADDFENHEALAETAINDLQQLAVSTRQHAFRIDKMINHYQQQLTDLEKQAALWSERAIKVRTEDEQKALQCVKRLRAVKQQIDQITKQLDESENQASSIQVDVQAIQEQILKLKTKKELLAARQNRSQLQNSLQGSTISSIDVERVFDRWEGSVVGDEFVSSQQQDPLSNTFDQQEEEMELRLMLEALENSKTPNPDQSGE